MPEKIQFAHRGDRALQSAPVTTPKRAARVAGPGHFAAEFIHV